MKHINFTTELLDFYNPEPDLSGEGSAQQTSQHITNVKTPLPINRDRKGLENIMHKFKVV